LDCSDIEEEEEKKKKKKEAEEDKKKKKTEMMMMIIIISGEALNCGPVKRENLNKIGSETLNS
jgi:hypothetical protein